MGTQASKPRPRRIGLIGGTFDPIHKGHLVVARAARRRFRLDVVYFVPCGRPPHKNRRGLSPFLHRYAMVALATAGEPRLQPSLLEAGPDLRARRSYYTIETVRRVRRQAGAAAHIYFILGADSYLYLPTWKGFRQLIRACDFIVASRPGFSLRDAHRVLPPRLEVRPGHDRLRLPLSTIYFLRSANCDVSSTAIRRAARRGRRLTKWVPRAVADYIEAAGLYRRR